MPNAGITPLLVVLIALAVVFDFINGFHDTANAVATVISTRVLRPWVAIAMAAVLNFVGAMSGTEVARTVSSPAEVEEELRYLAELVGDR